MVVRRRKHGAACEIARVERLLFVPQMVDDVVPQLDGQHHLLAELK